MSEQDWADAIATRLLEHVGATDLTPKQCASLIRVAARQEINRRVQAEIGQPYAKGEEPETNDVVRIAAVGRVVGEGDLGGAWRVRFGGGWEELFEPNELRLIRSAPDAGGKGGG